MKRKLTSPSTSPTAPDPKRQHEDSFTPARPIPEEISSQGASAPLANRRIDKSLKPTNISVGSIASFKSVEELTSKTDKMEISRFDVGATNIGRYRDQIEVDLHLLDGLPYTAQISEIEAYKLVYRKALNIDKSVFYGAKIKWVGHPLIFFRLKEPIDIDAMPKAFEYYKPDFDSKGKVVNRKVTGEVRGVRDQEDKDKAAELRRQNQLAEADSWPITRWVKLEGTGYDIKPGYIEKCLDFFGSRETKIEVETLEFHDSESEDENATIKLATGNMSVKMLLTQEIPQFVPLYGQKVKFHYRGIVKSCTKCFEQGHLHRECKKEKVLLIDYVEAFMKAYPTFPKELYGRWTKLVEINRKAKENSARAQGQNKPNSK